MTITGGGLVPIYIYICTHASALISKKLLRGFLEANDAISMFRTWDNNVGDYRGPYSNDLHPDWQVGSQR